MRYAADFFAFARERENIRLRREAGHPWPWTEDPILREYRFCNVYREDDRVTRWFRQEIRDPVAESPSRSVLACTAFRWFNHVPSGVVLQPYLLGKVPWDETEILYQMQQLDQVVGGAYVIKSPTGMKKAAGLLWCLRPVVREMGEFDHHTSGWTLQDMHERLMRYPYLGRFMAYEVTSDLRWTKVLRDAPDIETWASAGPGCCRGLGWVFADDPTHFSYGRRSQENQCMLLMMELLGMSREQRWERRWEMREVEHVLCEFAKYRAAQTGRRLKRRYDASGHREKRA